MTRQRPLGLGSAARAACPRRGCRAVAARPTDGTCVGDEPALDQESEYRN
jgi:hypothetical protein